MQVECKLCGHIAPDSYQYNWHVCVHIPPPEWIELTLEAPQANEPGAGSELTFKTSQADGPGARETRRRNTKHRKAKSCGRDTEGPGKSDPLLCKAVLIHPAPDENREVDPLRCDPSADGARADAEHDRRWEVVRLKGKNDRGQEEKYAASLSTASACVERDDGMGKGDGREEEQCTA
eukprot:11016386-Lingulodinium_polyedra.AAC.1